MEIQNGSEWVNGGGTVESHLLLCRFERQRLIGFSNSRVERLGHDGMRRRKCLSQGAVLGEDLICSWT